MEFFWNDAHDLSTSTSTTQRLVVLIPVQNTVTMFHKIYYDEDTVKYFEDLSYLDGKFVKLIVNNQISEV